jgi:hypothetical protein
MNDTERDPIELGPMPLGRPMETVDQRFVRAPWRTIFELAKPHITIMRKVRRPIFDFFRQRASDGGGIVEMSADRPFGLFAWPTWWMSEMAIDDGAPAIRFRHIEGITKGMDVEWSFRAAQGGTDVTIVHAWDGPPVPLVGIPAATLVIGPVFIHGIASRTLAGLAAVAEQES